MMVVIKMLYIGSHVSFKKNDQLLGSVLTAHSYLANTFMFYTGAPQNTLRFPISEELTKKALEKMEEYQMRLDKVIVHAPYIINLANNDLEKHQFSTCFLKEELKRCQELGISNLVIHPGSHVGSGIEKGISFIVKALNDCLTSDNTVTILLETMAGKGSEIGSRLEELKEIIKYVNDKEHIGVCIDTCHLHDAGYDLSNFDSFLEEFDKIIGLSYLKCVHVNDSKNERTSHKDRHENIGYGKIGFDTLLKIVHHKKLEDVPKILETPFILDNAPYKEEIAMLKNKTFDHNLKKDEH